MYYKAFQIQQNPNQMNITPEVSGFLLINKPIGPTSFDCVKKIRQILGKKIKVGHTGTLDPLASGLIIVAIGREATREIRRFMHLDKTYIATGKLGELTDSFDTEGKVVKTCTIPENLSEKDIEKAIAVLGLSYEQTPPIFSALKFEGKPLYKIARKKKLDDEQVEKILSRKKRTVNLHEITLLSFDLPRFTIKAHVSHGTYIRSLINDIAENLAACATTVALERTAIGPFDVADAVNLDHIENIDTVINIVIPVESILTKL